MKFYSVDRKLNRFNDYIRGELKRRNLSQDEIAYRLGIPQSGLSKRLSGKVVWSLTEVILLCEILEIKETWDV